MSEPTTTFTDFGVEAVLADALRAKGIVHPFPIQELTLPMALKGADLIGQARTGTGKTLAFGLPLLQRVDPTLHKTQALVIVPTRELCLQVAEDLTVGAERGVTSIAIYGGVGYDEQIEALTGGVHVVIGTPGRTIDHLGRGNLDLSQVHTVVLDEADEMLDMGFLPDVERLLVEVPEDRQTLLFSATMPAVIVKLARRFMTKPTFMRAEAEERQTASTVEQHFLLVHRMDKPRVLARILQSQDRGGAFVFTRTKNMADRLVRELEDLRVAAIAVHGDLRQQTREKNLDRFRAGKADVLVATEVAARGLDVDNVTHVFNYDCPDDEKMYLHRIGRTARAGNRGVAVTFAEFNEVDRLNVIRKAVQADTDVAEVFSTSDTLTEMFDLPEDTPWDHMARGEGGPSTRGAPAKGDPSSKGGRGRSGGAGGSTGGGSSKDGRRRSSSDGRNKSRRGADGSRPASRDRPDRVKPAEATTSGGAARPDGSSGSSGSSSTSPRTRTRTRTRARTGDGASSSTDTVATGGTQRTEDQGNDRAATSRTRARNARPRSERGDTDRGSDTAASSASSSSSKSTRSNSEKSTRSNSETSTRSNSEKSTRSNSEKSPRSSSEKSPRSSSDRPTRSANKGGSSRGGSSKARGGSRTDDAKPASRSSDGGSPVRTTRRGEPARGDGTPRPRRRVQVDHLP